MAGGQAGATGAGGAAGAGAQPGATSSPIPEKYQVKKADGSLDIEASLGKWQQGHQHLEKKLGAGEAPPASPEDYKPTLPAGLDAQALSADPLYQSFLKGAHAKGLTNDQVSYVLQEFAQRQAMAAPSSEKAVAELRNVWKTEAEFNANARHAFKAVSEFGADLSDADRAAIDSNPAMLKFLAKVGAALAEDTAPIMAGTPAAQTWDEQVAAIKAHPGFMDPKHPEHKQLVAKQQALYERRYGKAPRMARTVTG